MMLKLDDFPKQRSAPEARCEEGNMQMNRKLNAAVAVTALIVLAGCGGEGADEEGRMASSAARIAGGEGAPVPGRAGAGGMLAEPVVSRQIGPSGVLSASMSRVSAQVVGGAEVGGAVAPIDTYDREAVRKLFTKVYMRPAVPMEWTGSFTSGNAGTVSTAYQLSTIERINWYRAMAGVPANTTLSGVTSAKAQQAAFMMTVNGKLSHFPPADWKFYTAEGAEAAASSNLAHGDNGPDAIDVYMRDEGPNNYGVGHRRFLLFPGMNSFGVGDVPNMELNGSFRWGANVIWILDADFWGARRKVRDDFVAWPTRGYVPYQTVYSRWSFAYPNADFSNARVTVTLNGAPLNVLTEPLKNDNGYDKAIVWVVPGIDPSRAHAQPDADMKYEVTVSNVLIDQQPRSFTYPVVVFDVGPVLRGVHSDYMVSYNNNVLTLSDRTGRDGVQTIKNPTRVDFTDASLAFDIEGNAGKAYRLYRAAFDRRPDVKGLGFWIGVMDQGMTINSVAREFAQSAEFATLYGRAPTHEQILRALYRNVLHREPDEAGKAYWARVLASGGTLEQLLVEFSESAENKGQVAGEVHSGILYEQYGSK